MQLQASDAAFVERFPHYCRHCNSLGHCHRSGRREWVPDRMSEVHRRRKLSPLRRFYFRGMGMSEMWVGRF